MVGPGLREERSQSPTRTSTLPGGRILTLVSHRRRLRPKEQAPTRGGKGVETPGFNPHTYTFCTFSPCKDQEAAPEPGNLPPELLLRFSLLNEGELLLFLPKRTSNS